MKKDPRITAPRMRASHVERTIVNYLAPRTGRNLVVPNVAWGWGLNFEADLVVVTGAQYAWEIEIKVRKDDLIKDNGKRKWRGTVHFERFRRFYYAIPEELEADTRELGREEAGIFIIKGRECLLARNPVERKQARKVTTAERLKLAELGAVRVWDLKEVLYMQNSWAGEDEQRGT